MSAPVYPSAFGASHVLTLMSCQELCDGPSQLSHDQWPPERCFYTNPCSGAESLADNEPSALKNIARDTYRTLIANNNMSDWSGTPLKTTPLRTIGTLAYQLREHPTLHADICPLQITELAWRTAVSVYPLLYDSEMSSSDRKFCKWVRRHIPKDGLVSREFASSFRIAAGGQSL